MDRVLIVGAHYDDAELGAGGIGAKLAAHGREVYKLTLTDNEHTSELMGLHVTYESSKSDSARACAVLGIEEVEFAPLPCTHLVYSKETMQRLETILFEKRIDTVFMHFSADYNEDHVEAHKICKTAARHCKNLLTYQSNGYILTEPYYPTIFCDISAFAGKKLQALHCYEKQHNRGGNLFEISLEKNRAWGYAHHCEYAEAFHAIKMDIEL